MKQNTIDGLPLWLLAQEEHTTDVLGVTSPFLLVNRYVENSSSSTAPTHELANIFFNPKVLQDFTYENTMAIQLKKSYRNNHQYILVGRSEECDIVISRDDISRRHLGFTKRDDRWYVVDFGSTNGAALNGERLEPHKLYKVPSQSVITLGAEMPLDMALIMPIELGILLAGIIASESVSEREESDQPGDE